MQKDCQEQSLPMAKCILARLFLTECHSGTVATHIHVLTRHTGHLTKATPAHPCAPRHKAIHGQKKAPQSGAVGDV
ncbi:MAG: hypothetical protein KAU29_04300 [Gammaproteobacteria bacterium]|nr:hypothetical protein [Gammaproteobacteria bacterium]